MDWQNAADFVANFVDYELLEEPTELVRISQQNCQYVTRM